MVIEVDSSHHYLIKARLKLSTAGETTTFAINSSISKLEEVRIKQTEFYNISKQWVHKRFPRGNTGFFSRDVSMI